MDPAIWGPPFWQFMHMVAMTYPLNPTAVTKRRIYDFVQTLPLFVPVESMGKELEEMLNEYPVTAYLDKRDDLVRWMHFIHNKINAKLRKPQISLDQHLAEYHAAYVPKLQQFAEWTLWKKQAIQWGGMVLVVGLIYYLYDR